MCLMSSEHLNLAENSIYWASCSVSEADYLRAGRDFATDFEYIFFCLFLTYDS